MHQFGNGQSRREFLRVGVAGAAALALKGPLVLAEKSPMAPMTHRERIEKALAFEPTDRLPFGFWWHFPNRDRAPRASGRTGPGAPESARFGFHQVFTLWPLLGSGFGA